MENKENVYEEKIPQTEQALCGKVEEGSTVLGKFKDVSALERAYSALQAEFTRRSQRLKTLESALKGKTDNFVGESGQDDGVEKLRAVAAKKREEGKEFQKFVTELEQNAQKTDCGQVDKEPVLQSADESASIALDDATLSGVEGDGVKANQSDKSNLLRESDDENFNRLPSLGNSENLAGVAAQTVYSSDALYEAVKKDESARMRIIGDYLASIRRSDAPLMKGGGNLSVTPAIKAKTISDAGTMALRLFQKDGANA